MMGKRGGGGGGGRVEVEVRRLRDTGIRSRIERSNRESSLLEMRPLFVFVVKENSSSSSFSSSSRIFFSFSPLFLFLFLFLFRNTLRFSVLDSALSNFSFFTPVFFGWNDFRTVKWRKRREREEGEEEEEEEGRMERGRKESNACLILLQHTSGPTFVFFPDNESRKYQGTRAFYWINRVSLLSNFVLWFWIVLRTILVTVLGISIDRMIWYQCLNHQ